jgi:hypothetical protein
MKVRKLFICFFAIFTMISVILYLDEMDETLGVYPYEAKINATLISKNPEFIYLGGSSFKTVGSAPVFADDCIGCDEIGDISIYRNTELKPELTDYTVKAQCGETNKYLVEKSVQLDEKGQKIGIRCLVSYPKGAHIFWTEGKEFWFINAQSLELAREFEKSEVYRSWKSKTK